MKDNTARDLTIAFAERARKKIAECECGGRNMRTLHKNCSYPAVSPCPSCSRLREIAEMKWLWGGDMCPVCFGANRLVVGGSNLGPIYAQDARKKCNSPHHKHNPIYTVPILRSLLEDLGELERFLKWLWNIYWNLKGNHWFDFALVLLSDSLMSEAVLSYFKEVE